MSFDQSAGADLRSGKAWMSGADAPFATDSPSSGAFPVAGVPRVFATPDEVLASPDLTREEKRAILASWTSDVWAVESAPALRLCPFGGPPVPVGDVLAALRALDAESAWVQPTRDGPVRAAGRRALQ